MQRVIILLETTIMCNSIGAFSENKYDKVNANSEHW